MKDKRPFLLARAHQLINLVELSGHYDEREQLNVLYIAGKPLPLVLNASAAWTGSKTEAAPGDDDPDPEAEGCY